MASGKLLPVGPDRAMLRCLPQSNTLRNAGNSNTEALYKDPCVMKAVLTGLPTTPWGPG